MRKPILAANWKMYKTTRDVEQFLSVLQEQKPNLEARDAVICAPYLHLPLLAEALGETGIALGAQNMHHLDEGAYTGEISAPMLTALGVRYVIIGHSERRQYFHETDQEVQAKVEAAHRHGLTPIICVGEDSAQRAAGKTEEVVAQQVQAAFARLTAAEAGASLVAYEPIWAIGTGESATAEEANAVISYIRSLLSNQFTPEVGKQVRIQYGGSVNPTNLPDFLQQPEIDGALVGGASLDPNTFLQLLEVAGR